MDAYFKIIENFIGHRKTYLYKSRTQPFAGKIKSLPQLFNFVSQILTLPWWNCAHWATTL